ncbi:MAG: hypothetical protein U1F57_11145 [bacterium]
MKRSFWIFLGMALLFGGCNAQSKPTTISGRLTLGSGLASKIGPSDVVFIIAFPAEAESQPAPVSANPKAESKPAAPQISPSAKPIAVQKIAPAIFPMDYQLSQDDILFPENRFEGSLHIIARVDKDGNAKSVNPGDLEGSYKKNPVKVGSTHVDFAIDKEN